MNTRPAVLARPPPFGGSDPNATRACLNFPRPSVPARFHTPTAGRRFHCPTTFVHANTTPARLQHRALEPGKNDYVSPSTFRLDLALCGCNINISSARLQFHFHSLSSYYNLAHSD